MSKSLKKLIDINRLREFKNKLVGTDSVYVQTGAVDQTVAGTKTFSKPIVGSVTGSSGSCTGNSATATKATKDAAGNTITTTYATKAENNTKANDSEVVHKSGDETIAGTKTFSSQIKGNISGSSTSCTGNSASATKATQDSAGQQIDTTYIKGLAVSGRTITYTKGDGSTGTITTQDTNTWTAFKGATSSANGTAGYVPAPTKGNQDKFFKADGTWATPLNTTYASMSASEATTGTATAARTISAKVLHDKINSNLSAYATKTELNNGLTTKANDSEVVHKSGDETIAGTKTFSKPIAGSVTGSSGSCTGNAATATTAKACTGNAATATKLATARSLWGNNFDGSAAITGSITGTPSIELIPATTANHGGFLDFHYNQSTADHTSRIIESASGTLSINNVTITTGKVVTATTFNGALKGNVTGNCSGSSGSCTGNAATATRADSAAKADTATNATYTNWLRTSSHSDHLFHTEWDGIYFWTYVTAGDGGYRAVRVERSDSATTADSVPSSAIRAQWYAAYPDGAEAHNAMWGGRDITAAFNAGTVSEHIADGTFKDIFPGDYITKSVTIPQVLADDGTTELFAGGTYTVNWVIADCDYWINKGDTATPPHHVVIVPQKPIFDARMNPTNTTGGGYAGSEMYKNIIPACAAGIVGAFGSDHILTFRDLITNTVDNNVASRGYCGWTGASAPWEVWASVQCNLMTEHMVTGALHYSSSGIDDEITTRQMSAFRLSERLINYIHGWWWWLRNVVSSATFANVHGNGHAGTDNASYVLGVRPFALLK